jgi:putative redox protein
MLRFWALVELQITKTIADAPSLVIEVVLEFNFQKKGYSDYEKRLIESVAGTSPVPSSIHQDLKQTIKFNW